MSYDYESTFQLFLHLKSVETFDIKSRYVDVPLIKGISSIKWRLKAESLVKNYYSGIFIDVNVSEELFKQNLSFAVRIDVMPMVFSLTSEFLALDRSYFEIDLSEGFHLNGAGNYDFQEVLKANDFVLQLKATLTIKNSRDLVPPTLALTGFFKDISNPDLADFSIQIGSDTWKANKFILSARCPVLRRMLANMECEELNQSLLKIDDITKDTFEIFFQFLYTSHVPNLSLKQATDLLIVANKYDVQELKNLCDDTLVQLLEEADPVHVIFQFAHVYNCSQELKLKAFGFVQSKIFGGNHLCDEYVEKPEQVKTLVEMMAKMADEKKKFNETLKNMNDTMKDVKEQKIQE